jgi:serine/threonine protein kinase
MMQDSQKEPLPKSPGTAPPQFRNAIILPDGKKPIPLGSGVITAFLGEGGMANVYEIWNSQLEVHRAVKLLHPNCSEESKQRFQTEIKITAKLHHPNIIEIHGVGEWNGLPLIEMEKIEGHTLENLIFEHGALPVTVCTAIGIMISRALKYAHNQMYVIYGKQYHGVIHRDLKPSNIMICKDGTVKLMDFGIARPTDASIHTTDGSILGTMQYLSPEQLDGKEPDVRTDVYSLGTTLYEVLTGVQAFPEHNVSKLMMNKIKNEFKQLDDFAIKISPRLKKLISKSMVLDREKRIESSAILLAELEKIHKNLAIDTPEQVIKQLISQSFSEKVVVPVRRRFYIREIAIGLVFLVSAVATVSISSRIRSASVRQAKTQAVATAVVTQTAPPQAILPTAVQEPQIQTPVSVQGKKALQTGKPSKPRSTVASGSAIRNTKPSVSGNQKSFADMMIERHGTSDLMEILVAEYNHGNFLNASNAFKQLPPGQAKTPRAVVYNMRTLSALGLNDELRSILSKCTVQDGEVYLEKAKQAYRDGRINQAAGFLDEGLRSPRLFMDSDKLRCEIYFYKALCVTSKFDAGPTEVSYKDALDAWWLVRNELRSSPAHKYNKTAVDETQRIGEKYRKSRG